MSFMGRRDGQGAPNGQIDHDIRLDEDLWATRMLPEGLLERWLVEDGACVEAGVTLAELLIEGALVGVVAPVSGRLAVLAAVNTVVEPGSIIGRLRT